MSLRAKRSHLPSHGLRGSPIRDSSRLEAQIASSLRSSQAIQRLRQFLNAAQDPDHEGAVVRVEGGAGLIPIQMDRDETRRFPQKEGNIGFPLHVRVVQMGNAVIIHGRHVRSG